MRRFDQDDAALLAATEVLPGEWRDLSDLLLRLAKQNKGLRPYLGRRSTPGDELGDFLAENLDPSRVAFWGKRLAALADQRPGVTIPGASSIEWNHSGQVASRARISSGPISDMGEITVIALVPAGRPRRAGGAPGAGFWYRRDARPRQEGAMQEFQGRRGPART